MTAGMNAKVNVIRLIYTDDEVGGSYPSGTILHSFVDSRIDEDAPNSNYIGQGLETLKTYSAMFWGHNLEFREQDEVEVVSPPNHRLFGQRLRIKGLRGDSVHPAQKRGYWTAVLTRSDIAHRNEFQ